MATPSAPSKPPVQAGRSARYGAYARLVKIKIASNFFLGLLIAWSLLPGDIAFAARSLVGLGLSLVAMAGIVYAGAALDDVQGFRDGTDVATYTASDRTGLRPMSDKPLVDGSLTARQALRFSAFLAAVGFAAFFLAVVLVFDRAPAWFLPLALFCGACGVQYSYGVKVSYIGGQELLLSLGAASLVWLPYVGLTGEARATVAVEALLFGSLMLQVSVFSNMHDVDVDRRAGRRNVATSTSADGNRRFIVGLFAASNGLALVSVIIGWLAPVHLVLLVPAVYRQRQQLDHGVRRRDPLRARRLGLSAYRLGALGLAAGNVLRRL